MPESVKISELPSLASVLPNDLVPVVDSTLTQTSKATASQIAAIGGGPPGNGTVTTEKLADNAVTAAKCAFTGPDKLFSRTDAGAGQGTEITCTSWARGLLALASSNAAVSYISNLLTFASATFTGTSTFNGPVVANSGITGQVQAPDGTAAAPSYSFSGDTNTGLARLGGSDTISVVAGGIEQRRFGTNGSILSRIDGSTTGGIAGAGLYNEFGIRAYACVRNIATSPSITGGGISSVSYGFKGRHHVNFFPAMPDGNYTVCLLSHIDTTDGGQEVICRMGSSTISGSGHLGTASFLAVFVGTGGASWVDPLTFSVIVVR